VAVAVAMVEPLSISWLGVEVSSLGMTAVPPPPCQPLLLPICWVGTRDGWLLLPSCDCDTWELSCARLLQNRDIDVCRIALLMSAGGISLAKPFQTLPGASAIQ
jgi:hypothetical protein